MSASSAPSPKPSARLRVFAAVGVVGAILIGSGIWLLWPAAVPEPPRVATQGLDPEIVEALDKARSAVLSSPRSAKAWGELGEVFLAHVFNPEAIFCFEQAEKLDPSSYRWPYLQAMARMHTDLDGARVCLERSAQRARSDFVPHLRLAETLLLLERFDEADAAYRKVLELQPGHPRAYYGRGRAALQRGALREALGYLSLAADNPVSRKAAEQALAELYRREGDTDEAQRHARRAQDLPADNPWPDPILASVQAKAVGINERMEQARALFASGDLAASRTLVDAVIRKDPSHAPAYKLLGSILFRQNDFAGAERAFREAVRLHPEDASSLALLGGLLAMRKQHDEAIAMLRRAVEVNPSAHEACFNLARTLAESGRKDEAITVLRTGLRFRPDAVVLHKELGRLLLEVGKAGDAVSVLEKVALHSPEDAEVRQLLQQARSATMSTKPPSL
ncbi:MAG: tetratricopeptide repeat protein [Gemmatales bacterium]|nr:tetratricopeptide repeat protein [Gemmatales bacterium]MDW8387400.1 tetratricopeptide repeat protein [Gemmatales bacterium]